MEGLATAEPISNTINAAKLRKKLGAWFQRHARDLPWRKTADPYAIAVSELMLQQTTVAAVIPYFEKWMGRFPDVGTLAGASEQDVLAHWQGLGYYSRARNLHRAARAVRDQHGGIFPKTLEDLRALPGFGPYTAGAVAAFAFDIPTVVLDANILRVIARLGNISDPIDKAAGRCQVEKLAASFLPCGKGGRLHTASLMELGALICRPANPRCGECPVRDLCQAMDPAALPVKSARKPVEKLIQRVAFVRENSKVRLVQSEGPRWKGLWILPPGSPDGVLLHTLKFPITRFVVTLEIVDTAQTAGRTELFSVENLPPMPSPHARAVAALLAKDYDDLLP